MTTLTVSMPLNGPCSACMAKSNKGGRTMDKKVVISVVIGIAAFGVAKWLIGKLPSGNVITDTVKKAAAVASS
jgi:hypothetical protein